MFSKILSALVVPALLFSSLAQATQVDERSVGALTPLSAKSTVCNVLHYGAVADNSTNVGPAILSAFTKCAKAGGATIYIPPGTYSLATGVVLSGGSAYALQMDGLIVLTSDGSFNGNAFVLENTRDVEVFSSNGLGAINGQGYIERITDSGQNARLFRFISATDISFHDIILVDSPTFHLVFNDVSNMETYHVTIRGPDLGGTDGIDVICTDNCYIHDCEVTNRDECVSVKSPSQNVLIENMYCNQSGGMSIGSLTADVTEEADAAAVTNITMRNIYIFQCTQMLMIKTFPGGNGSTGYVTNSRFENFWAYDTTYALDIDQYWESKKTPDTGAVALSGLTFNNWTGTVDNGIERGPIVIRGSDIVPLTDITLTNFDMWTVNGDEIVNQCKNVYGSGYCAGTSTAAALTTFTTSVTVKNVPSGFTSPTSPAWGISGYGTALPIPIYTPAAFWSPVSSGVTSRSMTKPSSVVSSTRKAAFVSSTVKVAIVSSTSTPVGSLSAKSTSIKASSTSLHTTSSVVVTSSALGVAVSSSPSASVAVIKSSTPAISVSSSTTSKIPRTSSIVKVASSTVKSGSSSALPSSSITVLESTSSTPVATPTPTTKIAPSSSGKTSTGASISLSPSPSGSATIPKWGQCGGNGWDLPDKCVAGTTCELQNEWYSQCL